MDDKLENLRSMHRHDPLSQNVSSMLIEELERENQKLIAELQQCLAEKGELQKHIQWAHKLIDHAIDVMTTDQVGNWKGVRAWLEDELTPALEPTGDKTRE